MFDRFPKDLGIINALALVEMSDGKIAEALHYVDLGLAEAPRSRVFLVHKATLEETDKIRAVENYMEKVYVDVEKRAVETLLTMTQLTIQFGLSADAFEAEGEIDEAAAQREYAARSYQKELEYRAKVEEIAPEDPRFLEYRFIRSVLDEDWDEADKVVDIAARLDVDQAGGDIYRGRLAIVRQDFASSVTYFRSATEKIPYSAKTWRQLATAYRGMGNFAEALNAL